MDVKKLDKLIKLLKLANHNPNDSEANLAARTAAKMLGEENYGWVENAKKNGGTPPSPKPESNNERFYQDPRTGTLTITLTSRDIHSDSRIGSLINELKSRLEPRTWGDVLYRSKEPFWSSRPPPYREPERPPHKEPPRADYQPFTTDSDFGEDTGVDWEAFYKQAKAGVNWQDFFNKQEKYQQERRERERAARVEYEQKQQEARERSRRAKEGFNTKYTWNNPENRRKVYEKRCRDCSVCGVTQLTVDESNPFICYQCKLKF